LPYLPSRKSPSPNLAISVIGVCISTRASDAIFLIIAQRDAVGGVGGHVSGSVIAVAGELVVNEGWSAQVLSTTLCHGFVGEIAPGVIPVAVAPVFGFAVTG